MPTLNERLSKIEQQWARMLANEDFNDERRQETREWRKTVESRLRVLERSLWTGIGGLAALQVVIKFLL